MKNMGYVVCEERVYSIWDDGGGYEYWREYRGIKICKGLNYGVITEYEDKDKKETWGRMELVGYKNVTIIRDPRHGTEYLLLMGVKALDKGLIKEKVLRGIVYRLMRYYVSRDREKYLRYRSMYESLRKTDKVVEVNDETRSIIEEFVKIVRSR